MDARGPCPDSALLAAFLDGTLVGYERTAVVEHLADCAQCRAVAVTVVEFREVQALDQIWDHDTFAHEAPAPAHARIARWARRKTRAPSLAAAALIPFTVVCLLQYSSVRRTPPTSAENAVVRLINVADGQRATIARVSGTSVYAAPSSKLSTRTSPLLMAVAKTVRHTFEDDYGVAPRRAVGVAALLASDLDEAVNSLAIAAAAAPDDGETANDLAAAYYERAQRLERPEDLPAALDAVEHALRLKPALLPAWFNRALIITAFGLNEEARSAWQDYIRRDPDSPWSEEATRRERELVPVASEWPRLSGSLQRDPTVEEARRAVTSYPGKTRDLFDNQLQTWTAAARAAGDAPHVRTILRVIGEAFVAVQQEHFYRDVAASIDAAVAAGRHAAFASAHEALLTARSTPIVDEPARARREYTRAAEALSAFDSPLAVRARIEAETAAYYLGRYADAVAALAPIKTSADVRRYRALAARAVWITGLAEYSRNDLAAVRVAYEAMLEAVSAPADPDQIATAHLLLANLHEVLGDNHLAWTHRVKAISSFDGLDNLATKANLLLSAAGHALGAGHLAAARLFDARLLELQLPAVSEVQARRQYATTMLRLGDTAAAQVEFRRARQTLRRITDPLLIAKQEADLLGLESELLQATDPQRAVAVAERGVQWAAKTGEQFRQSQLQLRLANAALAAGDLARADTAASAAVTAFEALRASDLTSSALSDHERPLYTKAAQVALRHGDLPRAFDFMERRRLRALYLQRTRPAPMALQAVQQQLDSTSALVFFNQIEDELVTWVVTRDNVASVTLEMPASRAAALAAAHLLEISNGAKTPTVSGQIFDLLIRPVSRQLNSARTVAVIADAPYDRIAFAGLWDRERQRFLIEDYRLVSSPSATTYLPAERTPRPQPGRRVAILNASVRQEQTREKVLLTRELRALYEQPELREGDAATASELLQQIAERDVVHVAARASRAGDASGAASLVVSDNPGRRYSGELSAARLAASENVRARLVTLDVEPVDREFAGTGHVARALIAAGVSTVVGPIASASSPGLERAWIEFHRQYATGVAAAESLRRAQIAALLASDRRSGPWATLTLFGSTE